jgi:phosphate ABC transporter phosphate-binding protein
MRRSIISRVTILLLVGVGLGVLVYFAPAVLVKKDSPPSYDRLIMGGTSVAHIIMENRWKTAYRKEKTIEIDYESCGTTQGLTKLIDKKYAICCAHAPMTDEQKKQARDKGGEVIHVPVVLCAVVPVYNLKELNDKEPLQLSGEVLADIFLGKISRWDDPALQKLNPDTKLPDTKITVVHRSDPSGTTLIFTEYLAEVSAAWKKQMGGAESAVKWPVGVGLPRNTGVADHVTKTEGAIGYVDMVHAVAEDLPHAALQNKDKTAFVKARAESMTAAAEALSADLLADATFPLTNMPGNDSYPICGVIWAVCYQSQAADRQKKIVDFLRWVIHDGQPFAERTAYAPLPKKFVERAELTLKSIKTVP